MSSPNLEQLHVKYGCGVQRAVKPWKHPNKEKDGKLFIGALSARRLFQSIAWTWITSFLAESFQITKNMPIGVIGFLMES